ncbi:MAG: hypothetical protein PHG87_00150 [Candidatus Omnitrophica bacterium]|nr:hypothetical protein [Candidatus Omnitrophota bacterium]
MNHPLNTVKSITLVELLISIIIVTIMILSFYSLETFTQGQVINSDRRAKVQNQLAYALEHMSKYVQQAQGNLTRPPIEYFPAGNPDGFRVWVDFNQTPWDLTDDSWVRYQINGNTITASCGGGSCPASFNNENLTTKVLSNFSAGIMPSPLPNNPAAGFYVKIDPNSSGSPNVVEIGLVGRYNPSQPYTLATRLTNPQVQMKTRIICNNSSTN